MTFCLPTSSFAPVAGITVAFLAKRPKKIKLTIKLDGKDYAGEIDQDGSVRWKEEMYVFFLQADLTRS